jgi:hypothetical protein
MLQQALWENYEMQKALAGQFSLWSGKVFTYQPPRYWDDDFSLRVKRVYREGERIDDVGYLDILPCGTIKYFSFHSFTGETEIELNEARIYVRDCAELLSREFVEKITADFNAKADEFKSLMAQEKILRDRLTEIEKEGGAE